MLPLHCPPFDRCAAMPCVHTDRRSTHSASFISLARRSQVCAPRRLIPAGEREPSYFITRTAWAVRVALRDVVTCPMASFATIRCICPRARVSRHAVWFPSCLHVCFADTTHASCAARRTASRRAALSRPARFTSRPVFAQFQPSCAAASSTENMSLL